MAAETIRQGAGDDAQAYRQLVLRAWTDEAFKARLLAEPEAVVREQGMSIPPGQRLTVVEVPPGETYIVLRPPVPGISTDAPKGSWTAVLLRAAADPAFRAHLQADPTIALAEEGIELPADRRITVLEPGNTQEYVLLPPRPDGIDADGLEQDTAGFGWFDPPNTGIKYTPPSSDDINALLFPSLIPAPAVVGIHPVDFNHPHQTPNPNLRTAFKP
jgi:nitrile hydratase